MLNIKIFQNELIGFEGSIIELSEKLVNLGCEDISWFGNWVQLLEEKKYDSYNRCLWGRENTNLF
ncbi:hypothetical protein [uncultured Clostridium sp.]|uniref:hypothetical protein n=1 Tax=uncultured Clostridium sp. TaxID=59620 RepID=UPI0026199AC8|nr:hypothetical protein [uncultured Clostridium sp.]